MTIIQTTYLNGLMEAETTASISQFITRLQLEDLSRLTVSKYHQCLLKYRDWLKGEPVSILSAKQFLANLKDRNFTRQTVICYYHALKHYLTFLDMDLKIRFRKKRRLPPPYHSVDQVSAILKAAYERNDNWDRLKGRDCVIIYCLAYTGMRRSELHGLTTNDIDFQENTIRVRCGKGDHARIIPIAAPLREVLRPYIVNNQITGRLFTIKATRVSKAIKRYAILAGVNNFHAHSFRHFFATQLIDNHVQLNVIQELLGHADISTTALYLDVRPQHLHAAVTRLPNIGQSIMRGD